MLSPRFARHCTLLHKAAPAQAILKTTVSSLTEQLFQDMSDELQPVKQCIVDASIALCQEAATTFLPTPRKQHYRFTTRHIFELVKVSAARSLACSIGR